MKIIGVTQARISSTRLPKKVLLKIKGKSLLQYHLERAQKSKLVTKWIVATTEEKESNLICEIATSLNISCFKGSTDNVLDRFYQSVKDEKPDYIVRITSDCPLIDANLIDEVIKGCLKEACDYASNTINPTFPDGVDIEVFSFYALEKAWVNASLQSELEHVTPYIWKNCKHHNGKLFKSFSYESDKDYSSFRLTVDEINDFELVKILIENLGGDKPWKNYIEYLEQHPEILKINSSISRNEGFRKSLDKDKNNTN